MTDVWTYRDATLTPDHDISGYHVEATDGHVGEVDESGFDVGSSYIVVDTGFWIFGKKRLVPAAAITGIDHDEQKVFVKLSKDEIKAAPDLDLSVPHSNDVSRNRHAEYYGPFLW
ncbi:MAG: PRC-barrel domain-containing protein [Acidimicrobiia bacterium]